MSCEVCKKEAALYKCPRCAISYCSVACYTSHSEHCTEAFYRQCVEEELRSQPPPDPAEMRRFASLGVDFVTSNRPDVLRGILGPRGGGSSPTGR